MADSRFYFNQPAQDFDAFWSLLAKDAQDALIITANECDQSPKDYWQTKTSDEKKELIIAFGISTLPTIQELIGDEYNQKWDALASKDFKAFISVSSSAERKAPKYVTLDKWWLLLSSNDKQSFIDQNLAEEITASDIPSKRATHHIIRATLAESRVQVIALHQNFQWKNSCLQRGPGNSLLIESPTPTSEEYWNTLPPAVKAKFAENFIHSLQNPEETFNLSLQSPADKFIDKLLAIAENDTISIDIKKKNAVAIIDKHVAEFSSETALDILNKINALLKQNNAKTKSAPLAFLTSRIGSGDQILQKTREFFFKHGFFETISEQEPAKTYQIIQKKLLEIIAKNPATQKQLELQNEKEENAKLCSPGEMIYKL